MFFVITSP